MISVDAGSNCSVFVYMKALIQQLHRRFHFPTSLLNSRLALNIILYMALKEPQYLQYKCCLIELLQRQPFQNILLAERVLQQDRLFEFGLVMHDTSLASIIGLSLKRNL